MKMKQIGVSLFTLGSIFLLGACSKTEESGDIVNESVDETVVSDSSGDEMVDGEVTLKDDGFFKEVVSDGIDPKVKDTISYKTDYKNSDWDKITLDIEKIKIVNVEEFKDDEDTAYKELVSLKYKLTNEDSEDKHIKPDKAELVLKDGSEVDAKVFMDYWDDEVLTKDKHKDGYIHFKVKEENELKEIESLKLTFKAKDSDDKEVTHTYDIDLPLDAN